MHKTKLLKGILLALACTASMSLMAQTGTSSAVNVPAGDLADAIEILRKQTGSQIIFRADQLKGVRTQGVKGTLSAEVALKRLLEGSGFTMRRDSSGAILITKSNVKSPSASQKVPVPPVDRNQGGESVTTLPEILVKGARQKGWSVNGDIERTEDDPQPYIVFRREEVERSQAANLEEFLRARLPMNSAKGNFSQNTPGDSLSISNIDLRGLGANQTLILVDGRRLPGNSAGGSSVLWQPDINGIPLSAIERIEALPSTAGGIYGGSATGGVVNIVLRHDYQGMEVKATYGNTFKHDLESKRLDVSGAFSLQGGRTQVTLSATRAETGSLLVGERDFAENSIALQLRNNPSAIIGLTIPPLGATANIRSVSGDELTLKPELGGAALGAAFTHIPLGYAGPESDNGAALLLNAGTYNLDLPKGINGKDRALVSSPKTQSFAFSAKHRFAERVDAFLDLYRFESIGNSYSAVFPSTVFNLPVNAPNNPFQQAIAVTFPVPNQKFENRSESTTQRVTGGLIVRLPHDWFGEASYGWSRSRLYRATTGTVLDTVGNCVLSRGVPAGEILGGGGSLDTPCAEGDSRPALNVLQDANTYPIDFSPYILPSPNTFDGPNDTILKNATLRLGGPTLTLPGGEMNVSVLLEHRTERKDDGITQRTNATTRAPTYTLFPHRSQSVDSAYVEANIPLVSVLNPLPFVKEFEIQASTRYDRYTTRSVPLTASFPVASPDDPFPELEYTTSRLHSTDYTLGLRYKPFGDLALRASWGTGFLPPSVHQTASTELVTTTLFASRTDPKRGNTPVHTGNPITAFLNGSPNLKAEESKSWSVGAIYTPEYAPGLRVSIDYTRIEKSGEIQNPTSQFILDNEDIFPGRIIRGENLPGDEPGWAGPITEFDLTLINIARTSLEAYDIQADYEWNSIRFGDFHGYLVASYQPHYRNKLLPNTPEVERVGFNGGLLEWRGNLGIDWKLGAWSINWNTQYFDSYSVYTPLASPLTPFQVELRERQRLNQGSNKIPRQIYHDVIASYRFDKSSGALFGLMANSEVSIGIQNVFNTHPPIIASTSVVSGGYSTYGDPRLRRFTLVFRKSFGD